MQKLKKSAVHQIRSLTRATSQKIIGIHTCIGSEIDNERERSEALKQKKQKNNKQKKKLDNYSAINNYETYKQTHCVIKYICEI